MALVLILPMDIIIPILMQHLEGGRITSVTMDTNGQDQIILLVKPVGTGAQDLTVLVRC